jgi:imidazolonepropionase
VTEGPSKVRVLLASRVVTCDPERASSDDPLAVIAPGGVILSGDRIDAVGTREEVLAACPAGAEVIDGSPLITPGLVDAHTHAPFTGSRHLEYAMRMGGAGYEEIGKAGGGIVSTMRAVRAVGEDALAAELCARLARMARAGVTTVEAKSGYGLDLASERKQLVAVARASLRADLPRLVPTYLALHALPPEAGGDRDRYAARVLSEDLPAIAGARLARFVDAYVDRSAFSVAHARPVLERARALGLGVRLHVGQFADVGGAELAASVGAASADHLEHLDAAGASRLADAGVRAVLLPVASFTLAQAPPPIALLREAGVRMVVASDANPGTAPTESLPLAIAFAVRLYGLTVAEAILGATREAALSLGLTDVGVLRVGARADVVSWDLPHEAALAQPLGVPRAALVLRDGVPLAPAGHA